MVDTFRLEDLDVTNTDSVLFNVGVVGAGGFGAFKAAQYINTKPEILETINKLPGAGYLNSQLAQRTVINNLNLSAQTIDKTLLSHVMAIEEASPLHILRTLQLSNLIQPFVEFDPNKDPIKIAAKSVQAQQDFYTKLLENAAKEDKNNLKRQLKVRDLQQGFFYHQNKLYGATAEGTINKGDVILEHAKVILANVKNGKTVSVNQIAEKFANTIGATLNHDLARNDPLLVIGAKSEADFATKWGRSYGRFAMDIGYKSLDNPLGGFEELMKALGGEHLGFSESNLWKKMKSHANINLGTGGIYTLGTVDSLKLVGKNIAVKSAKIYLGYQVADSILRNIVPSDTMFSQGITTGLANIYTEARVGFAQVWSDRFQGYREAQEQSAPESTKLTTLLAFPAAGAIAGAQMSYFNRMRVTATQGLEASAAHFSEKTESAALAKFGIKGAFTPMKRASIIGSLAGAALTLPWLPGALIGESSEELKAAYSGEKEEAVKANAGWFMGGNKLEGEHTKYFAKNWYASLKSDAKDKVRYGDDATKKSLNPFLHPLDYIRNPYRFEEMHEKDMPFPIWGMDISYGSFLGKMFEKTIGSVIKPDIMNPKILAAREQYQSYVNKNIHGKVNGFERDSQIDSFKHRNMMTEASRVALTERVKESEAAAMKEAGKIDMDNILSNAPAKPVEGLKSNLASMVDMSKYNVVVDDADTVILKDKSGKESRDIEIRIAGLDAPEVSTHKTDPLRFLRFNQEQEYGKEATDVLKRIISEQKDGIGLAINKTEMSYGRYVGVLVGDNGKNINLEVLRQGAAAGLPWGNTDLIGKREVLAAEGEAKKANAGMWALSRYRAVDLYNKLTGQRQTYNTLSRLDKLAERPELAAYATYLDSLKGQTGPLTEEQQAKVSQLASAYQSASEEFKQTRNNLRDAGMSITPVPSSDGSENGLSTSVLNFTPDIKDRTEKDLVSSGAMRQGMTPSYNPRKEALTSMYNSIGDFTGVKGWTSGLAINSLGMTPETLRPQLARSGEATSFARDLREANLGDLLGIGEVQRKLIGTSSDALPDRANPMKNSVAPKWLPRDATHYFIDFSKGNFWGKVERGEERLGGKGFEANNPELKGMKVDDYPLVYKYKILSDVAKGSREQINMRRHLLGLAKDGKLSKRETDVLTTTLDQEEQRGRRKTFYEQSKTSSSLWFGLAHSVESPLEMLTPLRPVAKLLHQRTAIEDYSATQLGGTDTAIWTNPFSHFIKPAFNKVRLMVDKDFKPKEARERDTINEYFDKLKYLKSLKNGADYSANRTVIAASYSGLNTKEKILKFQAALPDNQKDYFEAFSKESNKKKREKILEMLPADISRAYQQIWTNNDIAAQAKKSGKSVEKALAQNLHKQTNNLREAFGSDVKLSSKEIQQAKDKVAKGKDWYATHSSFSKSEREEYAQDDIVRSKAAKLEAAEYVSSATGIPSTKFAGWDPRLTTDDIKIRTLSIGHEDLKKFGFWKGDEERMNRMTATMREPEVTTQIDRIKREMSNQQTIKQNISNTMFKHGFRVSKIDISDSAKGAVIVREN